jgi:RNA polymerase II-associated factor 1
LNQLGKPLTITSGVSFLRRTEYITAATPVGRVDSGNPALRRPGGAAHRKKRIPDSAKDDPFYIHRAVIKGFNIAYPEDAYTGLDSDNGLKGAQVTQEEKNAWAKPKHPTKSNLTLLDTYPVLPDLEAIPDNGSYMVLKYQNNPCSNVAYDPRLDVAIVRPIELTAEEAAKHEEKVMIAAMDPSRPVPMQEWRYQSFIPENKDSVDNIKRKFNTEDPEHDSEDLYDSVNADGARTFKYKRLRTYETSRQEQSSDPWNDTVAMVLHDDGTGLKPKAAYIYPIISRTSVRASRPITMGMLTQHSRTKVEDEAETVDYVELTIRDPTEEERENIVEQHLKKMDPTIEV